MTAQGLGNSAQRTAQVIEHSVGLRKLRGQHTEVFDNRRIAGHRAFDHVREYPHHVFVEGEVRHLGQRLGENAVGFFAHGGSGEGFEKRAF
ncbi:hypothetical protein ALQ20_200105 [Pseudomonas syringae pv. atrofaciens]|nr:hypothetical protein ALQ20_200105 [Pseudomonas syringae pv. atrofaciens]